MQMDVTHLELTYSTESDVTDRLGHVPLLGRTRRWGQDLLGHEHRVEGGIGARFGMCITSKFGFLRDSLRTSRDRTT